MEPDDRGRSSKLSVKGFFRNSRHRRSKSRPSEAISNPNFSITNTNSRPPEPSPPKALEITQEEVAGSTAKPVAEYSRLEQAPKSYPQTTHEFAESYTDSLSVKQYKSDIWKAAYKELRKENNTLVLNYEAILRDDAGIPVETAGSLTEQLAMVVDAQRRKVDNKQWQFQWFGHPQSVRDTIDRILNITQKYASIISVGMAQAPAYVSIPWSAVTALIPLMMNEFTEHKNCIEGLETVTKITFRYQMAEEIFLGSNDTRNLYKPVVMNLYKKILEYQALSIRYFGRSTLRRLGTNIGTASTQWADMPKILSTLDNEAQRSLSFLGQRKGLRTLVAIYEILSRQESEIQTLNQNARAKGDEIAEVTRWACSMSVEFDHRDVRQKLGEAHHLSGRWFLQKPSMQAWR